MFSLYCSLNLRPVLELLTIQDHGAAHQEQSVDFAHCCCWQGIDYPGETEQKHFFIKAQRQRPMPFHFSPAASLTVYEEKPLAVPPT